VKLSEHRSDARSINESMASPKATRTTERLTPKTKEATIAIRRYINSAKVV